MADNVTVDNGALTDYVVSADEDGDGAFVARVKLAYGANGSSTHAQVDADGVLVNLGANNDITDGGGSLTVDAPVATPVFVRLSDGSAAISALPVTDNGGALSVDDNGGSLTVDYATTGSGTATGALRVELPTNGTGVIATVGAVTAITNALPAGTNAIGKLAANDGVDVGDVTINNATSAPVNTARPPLASSTYSGTRFLAIENDVDVSVKGSAGNLMSICVTNMNASRRYLQLHNKATAPSGGDTAALSFPIPAGTSTQPAYLILGDDFLGPNGHHFTTGIAVGISTAAATFTAATTTDHTLNGTYV